VYRCTGVQVYRLYRCTGVQPGDTALGGPGFQSRLRRSPCQHAVTALRVPIPIPVEGVSCCAAHPRQAAPGPPQHSAARPVASHRPQTQIQMQRLRRPGMRPLEISAAMAARGARRAASRCHQIRPGGRISQSLSPICVTVIKPNLIARRVLTRSHRFALGCGFRHPVHAIKFGLISLVARRQTR
jgi:hypothetical protein